MVKTMEIERKFLVNKYPSDMNVYQIDDIEQFYIATGEEEIRFRKYSLIKGIMQRPLGGFTSKYIMTVKRGTGLLREENEFVVSQATYDQAASRYNGKIIFKTRTTFQYNSNGQDYTWFIDEYANPELKSLIVAEIEFSSLEEASNYVPPSWVGEEVTFNRDYKNQALWERINK